MTKIRTYGAIEACRASANMYRELAVVLERWAGWWSVDARHDVPSSSSLGGEAPNFHLLIEDPLLFHADRARLVELYGAMRLEFAASRDSSPNLSRFAEYDRLAEVCFRERDYALNFATCLDRAAENLKNEAAHYGRRAKSEE